jgi:hypothetical protein
MEMTRYVNAGAHNMAAPPEAAVDDRATEVVEELIGLWVVIVCAL